MAVATRTARRQLGDRTRDLARDQRAEELRQAVALPDSFYVWEAEQDAGEAEGDATAPEGPTTADIESRGWEHWLRAVFPGSFGGFAQRHIDAWDFVWNVELGKSYPAQVDVWPRGGGKSSTLEKACAVWGAKGTRKFILYVRETQEQANASVQNIAEALQSPGVERFYPDLSDPAVNKFGRVRRYTQRALITRSGFIVVGIGLDAASRGLKIGDYRPDGIILDDIDNLEDTPAATRKKMRTITNTILPLGTNETLVWMVQNLIHSNSVAARLTDGRADFLLNRTVRGPIPAVQGLQTVWQFVEALGKKAPVITSGRATWVGQSLEACQDLIFRLGLKSFLREQQHRVKVVEGALWKDEELTEAHAPAPAAMLYVVVGVDPSGNRGKDVKTAGDEEATGNECGIVVMGLGYDGIVYTLADRSINGRPSEWGRAVVAAALEFDADQIVAESNFGGEMVRETISGAARAMGYDLTPVPVALVNASKGKRVRAEPIAALMPEGLNLFAEGEDFALLEEELTTWTPDSKESPNRLDAYVWGATRLLKYLRGRTRKTRKRGSVVVSTGR